jgi:hypothetical protein
MQVLRLIRDNMFFALFVAMIAFGQLCLLMSVESYTLKM